MKKGSKTKRVIELFDNSFGKHELIAHKLERDEITIIDKQKFNLLKEFYDKER